MRFKFIIIMVLISTAIFGNSIFSFEGMPIQSYGCDVYSVGMGGTGSGDLFRVNTNYFNPANVITANKVILSTAVSMGYQWYSDNIGNSYRDNGLFFPYFNFAVPISNHKFAFNFNSFSSGNIENEKPGVWEGYEYIEINRINSSIFKAELIYAYKNPFVNAGLSLDYYLGHRVRYWEQDFDDIYSPKYEVEKRFRNAGFSFGINKKIGNLSFGTFYSSAADLEGETIYKSPDIADTLDLEDKTIYEIPQKISTGITWKFMEKFKVSFDANYELWKNTEIYDENTYRLALGLAYDPLSGYGQWYERIPLRCGGHYRVLPFEKNNNKIDEKSFSFGGSIPLKSSGKKIDIGINYLLRGDKNKHGVREKTVMFYFGITGFDIFSKRAKRTGHREIPKVDY